MEKLYSEIEKWMVSYKKNSVKPTTYDRLLVSLELMSKYEISDIPLEMLGEDDIQEYINKLVEDDYALTTIKKQLHLIGEFITYANLKGLISRPIHKGAQLPSESSVNKHKRQAISYDKDEQKKLRCVLQRFNNPASNAITLMLESGMRVGEALALEWSDVDWRRRAIRVSKTVVRITSKKESYVQNGAKSFTSNRTIPLSTTAFELLTEMHQSDESGSRYIFHDEDGRYLTYEAMRWWTKKTCREARVPYLGLHVFRHTFATNCYERGCDVKRLSKLLGHSDVTITYNVYIHLFGDALEELRSVVG